MTENEGDVDSLSSLKALLNSMKDPGQPWSNNSGIAVGSEVIREAQRRLLRDGILVTRGEMTGEMQLDGSASIDNRRRVLLDLIDAFLLLSPAEIANKSISTNSPRNNAKLTSQTPHASN